MNKMALRLFSLMLLCIIINIVISFKVPFHRRPKQYVSIAEKSSDKKRDHINLRLPINIVPDSYRLQIAPFFWNRNFTFYGEVSANKLHNLWLKKLSVFLISICAITSHFHG